MTFSEKLYKLRKEKGLSQEQLAEKLLISRQAISKWESGTAMPESDKLLAISRFFGVSLDYLMKEEIEVLLKNEECDCESVTERSVLENKEQEWSTQKAVEVQHSNSGKIVNSTSFLGCIICIVGIIGLILWGLITIFKPEASSQISESSAIHIDGNGIFLIICVLAIVLGASFLLRKPGNGDGNEKNK